MQELALIRPGCTAVTELVKREETPLRREFEARLAERGTLAYRVARGVLRNRPDAEDVAQEAMLQAYRRFARRREGSRFRASAGADRVSAGLRPGALGVAAGAARDAVGDCGAEADGGGPGGVG